MFPCRGISPIVLLFAGRKAASNHRVKRYIGFANVERGEQEQIGWPAGEKRSAARPQKRDD